MEVIVSQYCFAVYPLITKLFGAKLVTVPAKQLGHDLPLVEVQLLRSAHLVVLMPLARQQHDVAFHDAARADRFVECDGDAAGRGVSDAVDVDPRPVGADAGRETFALLQMQRAFMPERRWKVVFSRK